MSKVLQHPFTCVIAGPTSCGKTHFCIKLVKYAKTMIFPSPHNIVWCYGIYQPIFNELTNVTFHEGMPDNSETFPPNTLLIIDDLMTNISADTSNIFTRGSHHLGISVIFLTQNLFYSSRHNRTIALNTQYLILFRNPRDATQIAYLARQMYPSNSKFLTQAFNDATSKAYGYLFIDLKAETDDNFRIKTNIFPDDFPNHYVYIPRK